MHSIFFKKIPIAILCLLLLGTVNITLFASNGHADIITPAQLNDVSSQVKVLKEQFRLPGRTNQYSGIIAIHQVNPRKNERIDGALVVVLEDLTPGVKLINADGMIGNSPYLFVPRGFWLGSNAIVAIRLENPSRTDINYAVKVHQLVSGEVASRAVRKLSKPFTIAALPDTQVYAEDNLIEFQKQIDWLLANYRSKNIKFVAHLGDVVDNGTDLEQWDVAMGALEPLLVQDDLPFSIVRGNHDDPEFFLDNISPEITQSKPWFVAAAPGNLSQAQVFRVEGACLLHIGFQKDPTVNELEWANTLLKRPELQGLPVIVSTHDYIDGSGKSMTGRLMWDSFVKKNPMVFMVLNGHTHTEYALVNHNDANRPVFQMLSDYQDRNMGGNGLMRLVTIDPLQSKIFVETFSPCYRADEDQECVEYFENDADSQFLYDVNVKERLAYDTTFDFGPEPPPPPLPPLNDINLPYTHIFQNRRPLIGTTTPYTGTVDVQINENNANLNYGGEATLTTDMDAQRMRPGQIPPGSTIESAALVFNVTSSTKGQVKMHRMLVTWGEQSTWMDFTPVDSSGQPTIAPYTYYNTELNTNVTLPSVMVGGGVQADDVEAMSATDAIFACKKPIQIPFIVPGSVGIISADITAAVQAWANGDQPNYGWFFEPTSGDGWDFETAEGKQPPALVVVVAQPQ